MIIAWTRVYTMTVVISDIFMEMNMFVKAH